METSSAPLELADVFSLYGEQYRKKHKLPVQHRNAMFAIQACRTKFLGGHISQCDKCGHTRIFYNSCRNRHCPKCQNLKGEKWVDKLSADLLPMKYFHVVFTIPSELNGLCLVNQKTMYDMLFQAASQTILTLGRDKKHLGAETGLLAVLHTWGQNLSDHPHLHTLIPAGGWSSWNGYWKSSKRRYFVNSGVISELFRGKFLAALGDAYKKKELKFEGRLEPLQMAGNFRALLNLLYKKKWVVYAKAPFKNATTIIKYLGRYTHRVAITNQRIKNITDERISFTWKDYKDQGRRKLMSLTSEEFIRRFLLHVLPRSFHKIRYYGIFAARSRAQLARCKSLMAIRKQRPRLEGLAWNEVMVMLGHQDPLICSACHKGKMVQHTLILGKRGPP